MGNMTHAPYMHQATDSTNSKTAEFVILKGTTNATGTSGVTAVPHGTKNLTFQVNDSGGASTVTIQGSIDKTNWSTIGAYASGSMTSVPPPNYIPYIRVIWSGNTGTLGVIAAQGV